MRSSFTYQPKSKNQIKQWYNEKVREKKSSFKDFDDFCNWYDEQEKQCYYCGLKESESQEIVMLGILTSDRFPLNGKIKRGRGRGVWLEVDRKMPKENYSRNNCALSCYFCNNDKSDVFDESGYKIFIQDRYRYLKKLLGN